MSAPLAATGKRKRSNGEDIDKTSHTTVQVVAGSYERVLHGVTVSIPNDQLETRSSSSASKEAVDFTDTFLFHAHTSSIRCIALSPPSTGTQQNPPKRLLATGGTDERINLFSISAAAPPPSKRSRTKFFPELSAYAANAATTNRELGALTHHSSTVSALYFPSRSKLLSTSYDNTIAVTRARDWSLLSTIRAPLPKTAGRPSGDTAGPGEVPAGINAIAVHPSAKLCLSVGQGEKCMRLWNLVTGKKAGVLTFDKTTLALLGEGRWRGGEGRSVIWSEDGDEFAVGFERGALIYGQDCQIKGVARVTGGKVCQLRYAHHKNSSKSYLALSTEDGRLLFFDSAVKEASSDDPLLKIVGQLGNPVRGNRIKDFAILPFNDDVVLVVTGSSDGVVTAWKLDLTELNPSSKDSSRDAKLNAVKHVVGDLIGTCQTHQRITCMAAFIMDSAADSRPSQEDGANGAGDEQEEWAGLDSEQEEDDDDDDSDDSA